MAESDQQSLDALAKVTDQVESGADFYAILGLLPDANVAEIRAAFFRLAKLLHPDLPVFAPADRKAAVTKAFQAISAAHSNLSDPNRRREFDELTGRSTGVAGGASGPNPDLARIYMHRSKQILQTKAYAQAEDGLRAARRLFGDKVDPECDVMLAWATFNNESIPIHERAAESKLLLTQVIKLETNDHVEAQANYYMAIWCKLQGEVPSVKGYLDRCLKLSPRHVDAQREQRLFERRRSSSSDTTKRSRRVSNAEKRRTSRNAIPSGGQTGEQAAVKVPLSSKKKKSFLDWLLGK